MLCWGNLAACIECFWHAQVTGDIPHLDIITGTELVCWLQEEATEKLQESLEEFHRNRERLMPGHQLTDMSLDDLRYSLSLVGLCALQNPEPCPGPVLICPSTGVTASCLRCFSCAGEADAAAPGRG
jgi:hypothetical protein